MTLTDRFYFQFALIVITFSFIDGFDKTQNNINDITGVLDDFDMTFPFINKYKSRAMPRHVIELVFCMGQSSADSDSTIFSPGVCIKHPVLLVETACIYEVI